jgi:hypothetical protein
VSETIGVKEKTHPVRVVCGRMINHVPDVEINDKDCRDVVVCIYPLKVFFSFSPGDQTSCEI